MTPDRSRWVVVVRMDQPEVYTALRQSFAGSAWVDVVLDRRRGDRRSVARDLVEDPPERRSQRENRSKRPEFRFAYHGDGFDVYEATDLVSGPCPTCGVMVSFEMPRFAEPPVRLAITVLHESLQPKHAQHVIDVQAFSATGRAGLACRIEARTIRTPETE